MTIYSGTIKLRRGARETWESVNPTLEYGEMAIVWDGTTPKLKVGNQAEDAFNDLPWLGTEGPPGSDGADGADGASAYEVAVANGFVGSEVDWLLSLIGDQGPQGPQGDQGPAGADGSDGSDALLAIGSDVTGGTAHAVLFVDVNGKLGQDPSYFYYNASTKILTLDGSLVVDTTTLVVDASLNAVAVGASPVSGIKLLVNGLNPTDKILVVKAVSSQSGNLTEWRDHNNNVYAAIDSSFRWLMTTGYNLETFRVGGTSQPSLAGMFFSGTFSRDIHFQAGRYEGSLSFYGAADYKAAALRLRGQSNPEKNYGATLVSNGLLIVNYSSTTTVNLVSHAAALLELRSTTQGFMPPKMTGAQVEAIAPAADAASLLVYATNAGTGAITSAGWWGWNGSTWEKLN